MTKPWIPEGAVCPHCNVRLTPQNVSTLPLASVGDIPVYELACVECATGILKAA